MPSSRSVRLAKLAVVIACGAVIARAYSLDPPLQHTGSFGEPSCNESGCHQGNAVNATGGSLAITGFPAQYEPGKTYPVTVTINRTGSSRWGFECAVRQDLSGSGARQAGNLVATDTRNTHVDSEAGIQYVHHVFALSGSGPRSWTFNWVAPTTAVGTVRCGCASNAANGDGNNTGDFIYTTSVTATPAATETFTTTLYYPRLVTSDDDFTGIAVANLDGTSATLRFTSYDKTGAQLSGTDLTNPANKTLAAGAQLPIVDTQVFGSGLTARRPVGWFKIESTVNKLVGFFLTFNSGLTVLDGADVSSTTLTSFVFPEIEDLGFTQIHIANPNGSSSSANFELIRSDGTTKATAARTIASNGTVADLFTELFPGTTVAGSDYIRVTTAQGTVPFEFLGQTGKYVEGLNGQDTAAGATTLYSPQYVVGGGSFRTSLSVVSLDTAGTVTFQFFNDEGVQIGSTQTRSISARGKLWITDQAFFLEAGSTQTQGYVKITSSGPRLSGSVVFGDPARSTFSSSLPLVSKLLNNVVFGQVASDATYFTGVAILNPGDAAASATIEVFDATGNRVVTKTESIGARKRKSQLLTQYFSDLIGRSQSSGYIRVTVDQGVASFALFGTNSLSVLSAVPPQVVP
jgi:hypothetical protein